MALTRVRKILGIMLMIGAISIPIVSLEEEKYEIKAQAKGIHNYQMVDSNNTSTRYNYIAILEIPKISLYQGLVAIDNKYNDIKYNIQIINGSKMPDEGDSHIILAAHSGNSAVSFFNRLDELSLGDEIILYYQDYKYTYSVANSYEVMKTGEVNITRSREIPAISLITCKRDDDTKQLVITGYRQ